ncbi:unnamed protein product, partial [Nesidiocoris tenuis]
GSGPWEIQIYAARDFLSWPAPVWWDLFEDLTQQLERGSNPRHLIKVEESFVALVENNLRRERDPSRYLAQEAQIKRTLLISLVFLHARTGVRHSVYTSLRLKNSFRQSV